jgi:hypothetical protein
LQGLLAELVALDRTWAFKLEGSFLPTSAFAPGCAVSAYPSFDEGEFSIDDKGLTCAIQKHTLREHGSVLAGPLPSTFMPPVAPEAIRTETLGLLHGWWKFQLRNPAWQDDRQYQAYAVLTMCRILYTVSTGDIVPKPVAAAWARQNVGPRWIGLIERAENWRAGDGIADYAETLRFIEDTIDRLG